MFACSCIVYLLPFFMSTKKRSASRRSFPILNFCYGIYREIVATGSKPSTSAPSIKVQVFSVPVLFNMAS